MKISASAACIAFVLIAPSSDRLSAQSDGELQVTGGVSTASFTTPQGKIQVHVSSDAAPGDTISGVVLAEPAGATPQEQQANLGTLTGLVVELEGQQTKVGSRQYEWTVPAALRVGRAILTLRRPDGRTVSQVPVPIDPQPPLPRGPGQGEVELPSDLQLGRPVTIRARLDGTLRGKTVDVGGSTADLLAASPRQIVFRTTQTMFGDVPIRFTDNGRMTEGVTRAMGVRLSATSTQLVKGQRATLTTTVTGLGGITEPATLAFRNLSPAVVQIEGGAPRITIQPRDVKADGTYVDTRRLTGHPGRRISDRRVGIAAGALAFQRRRHDHQRRERVGGPGTIQDCPRRARPDPALGARGPATARGVPQAAGVERRRPAERVSVVALALLLRPSRQSVVLEPLAAAATSTDAPDAGDAGRAETAARGTAGSHVQRSQAMVVLAVPLRPRRARLVAVDRLPVRHVHARACRDHHRRPAEKRADQPPLRDLSRHSRGAGRTHIEALSRQRRDRRPSDERGDLRVA